MSKSNSKSVAAKAVASSKPVSAKAKPTAKAAPKPAPKKAVNPDLITSAAFARSGPDVLVVTAGKETVTIERNRLTKQLNSLATVGASLAAVRDYLAKHGKATAGLAKGVNTANAPHSVAAMASATRGAAKPATAKASGAAKAQRTVSAKDFAYSRAATADAKLATVRPDTFREYMVTTILAHKDTASAKAAHAKSGKYSNERLNFNWARANGYITY